MAEYRRILTSRLPAIFAPVFFDRIEDRLAQPIVFGVTY
jgi:hypothetical protein